MMQPGQMSLSLQIEMREHKVRSCISLSLGSTSSPTAAFPCRVVFPHLDLPRLPRPTAGAYLRFPFCIPGHPYSEQHQISECGIRFNVPQSHWCGVCIPTDVETLLKFKAVLFGHPVLLLAVTSGRELDHFLQLESPSNPRLPPPVDIFRVGHSFRLLGEIFRGSEECTQGRIWLLASQRWLFHTSVVRIIIHTFRPESGPCQETG